MKRKFNVHTLQQARAALAAERLKVEEQIKFGRPLPSKDSFEEFANEFLKMQERRISSRVVRGKISQAEYIRQKGIVETKLIPFFGAMKLAAVRKADVVKYIHDRTGEVSDGTIIKEVNTLKKLFNVALDLDKIPANPADAGAYATGTGRANSIPDAGAVVGRLQGLPHRAHRGRSRA